MENTHQPSLMMWCCIVPQNRCCKLGLHFVHLKQYNTCHDIQGIILNTYHILFHIRPKSLINTLISWDFRNFNMLKYPNFSQKYIVRSIVSSNIQILMIQYVLYCQNYDTTDIAWYDMEPYCRHVVCHGWNNYNIKCRSGRSWLFDKYSDRQPIIVKKRCDIVLFTHSNHIFLSYWMVLHGIISPKTGILTCT